MRFQTVPGDVVTPVGTNPALIPPANVILIPRYLNSTDVAPTKYVVGVTGATPATVDFWVEWDPTVEPGEFPTSPTVSSSTFLDLGGTQVISAGVLKVLDPTAVPPTPGRVYVRVTAAGDAGCKILIGVV